MDVSRIIIPSSQAILPSPAVQKIPPVQAPNSDNLTKDLNQQLLAHKEQLAAKAYPELENRRMLSAEDAKKKISLNPILATFPYAVISEESGQQIYVKPLPMAMTSEPAMVVVGVDLLGQSTTAQIKIKHINQKRCTLAQLYAQAAYNEPIDQKAFTDIEMKIAATMATIDINVHLDGTVLIANDINEDNNIDKLRAFSNRSFKRLRKLLKTNQANPK